ncbi:histidine kinase [Microvirga mediterraneensis]|uniref:PAS domain-containing protein n=1 Tax=Microvirga mediterraneensis TaxID=2754695 RepID=A0A838BT77_9HYPH|nr:histidine kinase [Microvirga mediterraneensis]MBA1157646.1 PAS domain-containing protein [Microvirga mediterraneensis]
MSAASAAEPRVALGSSSSRTRNRIALAAALASGLSFLIAAFAVYGHAAQDRHDSIQRGLSISAAASRGLEREADALGSVVKGLAASPLLAADDLAPFHRQLLATPRPDGSRFVLWNHERVLLSSAISYGGHLPPINLFPLGGQLMQPTRHDGLSVSERLYAPLTRDWIIALSLRLASAARDGERILTLAVPEAYFGKVVRESNPPDGWMMFILDRDLQQVRWDGTDLPLASSLRLRLADALARGVRSGHFEVDGYNGGMLVAFEHSIRTGYTVLSTMPAAQIGQPTYPTQRWLWYAGMVLALIGTASAGVALRTIGSTDALKSAAVSTRARYQARLSLMQEREFLQASLDALSAHIAVLDEAGVIVSVNEAWKRFAKDNGYPAPSYGLGMNYLDVCARARLADPALGQIHDGLAAVVAGRTREYRDVYRCDGPDRPRWFQMRATRFIAGALSRTIVAHEDITEVVAIRAEINTLSERLLNVQEEERERIAVELHDSTAQHLVAVSLNLMQVGSLRLPPSGRRILDEIDRSLEEALKELRIFTYLLHPPRLENDGLVSTVQDFAEGFAKRTDLETILRFDEAADGLSVDLQRALFRIVQEGLANVHRHAEASQVVLSLRLTSDQVILSVADNGRGMRRDRAEMGARQASLGVGIPGMRIRLGQFGGSLRIRSGRRGTIIRAAAPRVTPKGMAIRA